jgi:hypothetical protein
MAEQPGAIAPVEQPAVGTEQPTQATEPTAGTEPQPEGQQPETNKTFGQEDVDRIVKSRLAKESRRIERAVRAEIERDYLKQQLETRDSPKPAAKSDGEPKPEDFGGDYEKYLIAKAKHELKQELSQRDNETRAQHQQRQAQERAARMVEKIDAAREEFPDIDDIINSDLPFTEPMAAYFDDSELVGKLIHHLGSNPKELSRLAKLSPAGQWRELVKLESTLSGPPKTTQAPPPIVPNNARAPSTKSGDDMTDREWMEKRERDIRERNR